MQDWRFLYQAAVSETNPALLEQLVYQTEDAMFFRLQELARRLDAPPERNEIADAAEGLLALKVEKLGWPNPLA
jgi:hypothetical protein